MATVCSIFLCIRSFKSECMQKNEMEERCEVSSDSSSVDQN